MARVLVGQGTDDLAFRRRRIQSGVGDQVSESGHPGSCWMADEGLFHNWPKQYLCNFRCLSSDFLYPALVFKMAVKPLWDVAWEGF